MDDSLFECPLCFNPFSDPRLFPCGHCICFSCINLVKRTPGSTLRCPTCSFSTTTTDPSTLPKNFSLIETMEKFSSQNTGEKKNSQTEKDRAKLIKIAKKEVDEWDVYVLNSNKKLEECHKRRLAIQSIIQQYKSIEETIEESISIMNTQINAHKKLDGSTPIELLKERCGDESIAGDIVVKAWKKVDRVDRELDSLRSQLLEIGGVDNTIKRENIVDISPPLNVASFNSLPFNNNSNNHNNNNNNNSVNNLNNLNNNTNTNAAVLPPKINPVIPSMTQANISITPILTTTTTTTTTTISEKPTTTSETNANRTIVAESSSSNGSQSSSTSPHQIYLLGGFTAKASNKVWMYDDRITEWLEMPSLMSERSNVSGVFIGGYIYVVGGFGKDHMDSVERFNPDLLDSWKPVSTMTTKRSSHSVVPYNGYIYVLGGVTEGNSILKTVESFDVHLNRWRSLSSMDMVKRRSFFGSVVLKNEIYAIGGTDGVNKFGSVEKISFFSDSRSWREVRGMKNERTGLSSVAFSDHIFSIGGFNGRERLSSGECYDPNIDIWTPIPPMKYSKTWASAQELNGSIYVIGGFDGSSRLNIVEMYDPRMQNWSMGKSLPIKCSGSACISVNHNVV